MVNPPALPVDIYFFVSTEKISPSICPIGKTAKMFRCFSLLGDLFYVDAAINEVHVNVRDRGA